MLLPGRLRDSTLGDVLGVMLRARATGTLELVEVVGHPGRVHRIVFEQGKIVAIQSAAGPRIGELLDVEPTNGPQPEPLGSQLLKEGRVSSAQLRGALRKQLEERLELLFALPDAQLRFRIPRPSEFDPTAPDPLTKGEYLVGRPRAKERSAKTLPRTSVEKPEALRVLGLPPGATRADIQRAFRTLAAQWHPDRHPLESAEKRAEMLRRFAELSRAYHQLTG